MSIIDQSFKGYYYLTTKVGGKDCELHNEVAKGLSLYQEDGEDEVYVTWWDQAMEKNNTIEAKVADWSNDKEIKIIRTDLETSIEYSFVYITKDVYEKIYGNEVETDDAAQKIFDS